MPTTRPRFQVTETPEVERALKIAAERWPGASRSELVLRLFRTGADVLDEELSQKRARRLGAVQLSAGSLDAAYGPDYIETLRSEWPE